MQIPIEVLAIARLATLEEGHFKYAHNAVRFQWHNGEFCASASNGYVGICVTWKPTDQEEPEATDFMVSALELLDLRTRFPDMDYVRNSKIEFSIRHIDVDHIDLEYSGQIFISQKFERMTGRLPDIEQVIADFESEESDVIPHISLNCKFLLELTGVVEELITTGESIDFSSIKNKNHCPVLLLRAGDRFKVKAVLMGLSSD